jgi:signal transduction histidine kinase
MQTPSRVPENIALWALPKFVVAIGMIVTLLEDERLVTETARSRERLLIRQMKSFAELTSSLLRGIDVAAVADKVAKVISQTTNYRAIAVLLIQPNKNFSIAGHSGFDDDGLRHLQQETAKLGADSGATVLLAGEPVGENSYASNLLKAAASATSAVRNEIVVPLRSPSGIFRGFILLARPRTTRATQPEEFSTIEVLARDLAGAMEHAVLQTQLLRSEKMAGIGQLVAGVAHELNNPLTAVLGYTEIITEQVADVAIQRELGIIRKEAIRMKRIIENLQRFSRQQKVERRTVDLAFVVSELLKLRSYDLQTRGVQVEVDIDPELSNIVADDSLFNQVLLNVLNNSIEAVELSQQKRIVIEGRNLGQELQLRVLDSGAGFTDVNRVFDPFYTTKPPGKGTGLGLSICYGIVKDHGGEITASNIDGGGACITIKLPFSMPESPRTELAGSSHD